MICRRKNTIWLASYPKSGNTWIRVFLSNLFSSSKQPIRINNLIDTPIYSNRRLFEEYCGVDSSDLTLEEINLLRPSAFKLLSEESDNDIFIKVHDAWGLNKNNNPLFPIEITKGVIYLIRNPFDVALSLSNHFCISQMEAVNILNSSNFYLSRSRNKIYDQIPQNILSWSDHVISWINDSNLSCLIIRYEDLLRDPENYFSRILKFLKLDYSQQKIKKAILNSSFEEMQHQEKLYGFNEKPVNVTSFFKTGKATSKNELANNPLYKELFDHHKTIMIRFDY